MFRYKRLVLLGSILIFSQQVFSWGFYGHRLINRKAVFALPIEIFGFYKANLNYLEEHSVDPDKRRYSVQGEAPKHYIDLDHFLNKNSCQLNNLHKCLPVNWDEAKEQFGEDSLLAIGILPWNLSYMVFQLQLAFEANDFKRALKLSAEIGHYASDAHVPLHTTENYNGQLSGQKGIHALWESRIPERFGEEYDFIGSKARYLQNKDKAIWKVIKNSHRHVESVLSDEMRVREDYFEEGMYRSEIQGRAIRKSYTVKYIEEYNKLTGRLVEQRMAAAIEFVASLWYTAWVNAGQPTLDSNTLIKEEKKEERLQLQEEHER